MRSAAAAIVAAALFASPAMAADPPVAPEAPASPPPNVAHLQVPGFGDALVVEPKTTGVEQPLLLVLHARNGDPEDDCRKWAELGSSFGWVLCPSGPIGVDHNRSWGAFDDAKKAIDAAVIALRAAHGALVKPSGNMLIGFSEGALIAQLLGIREPERWSRWLLLGASDTYWGEHGPDLLRAQRRKITRVVLLTGEHDRVLENSLRAAAMIRAAHIPVRMIVRRGLAHEVPADRMNGNYQPSLRWLFELP
jgi:predicted esterase